MPPSHSKNLEGSEGRDCRSDLRTQRTTVNPQAGRICAGISWGFFEKIFQVLMSTWFRKVSRKSAGNSKQNPQKNPAAKSTKKSAEKCAKKIRQKIRWIHQKICRKIRLKIRRKIRPHNLSWKHAASSSCDRLSIAVCVTPLACSRCSTGTKQAFSDSKFTAESVKKILPDPLQSFRVKLSWTPE